MDTSLSICLCNYHHVIKTTFDQIYSEKNAETIRHYVFLCSVTTVKYGDNSSLNFFTIISQDNKSICPTSHCFALWVTPPNRMCYGKRDAITIWTDILLYVRRISLSVTSHISTIRNLIYYHKQYHKKVAGYTATTTVSQQI